MLPAIKFYDHLALDTDEVGNVRPYQNLSFEFVTTQTPVSHTPPEFLLHVRRYTAHFPCKPAIFLLFTALAERPRCDHDPSAATAPDRPLTLPSPPKGGEGFFIARRWLS